MHNSPRHPQWSVKMYWEFRYKPLFPLWYVKSLLEDTLFVDCHWNLPDAMNVRLDCNLSWWLWCVYFIVSVLWNVNSLFSMYVSVLKGETAWAKIMVKVSYIAKMILFKQFQHELLYPCEKLELDSIYSCGPTTHSVHNFTWIWVSKGLWGKRQASA